MIPWICVLLYFNRFVKALYSIVRVTGFLVCLRLKLVNVAVRFSENPTKHSPYVEQAIDCILEPVLEGVSKLKSTSQVGVISMATVAMCEAWTEFILKEKIKFR